jgi:hypothetical protein
MAFILEKAWGPSSACYSGSPAKPTAYSCSPCVIYPCCILGLPCSLLWALQTAAALVASLSLRCCSFPLLFACGAAIPSVFGEPPRPLPVKARVLYAIRLSAFRCPALPPSPRPLFPAPLRRRCCRVANNRRRSLPLHQARPCTTHRHRQHTSSTPIDATRRRRRNGPLKVC